MIDSNDAESSRTENRKQKIRRKQKKRIVSLLLVLTLFLSCATRLADPVPA